MKDLFLEVVIAPEITTEARKNFGNEEKSAAARNGGMPNPSAPGFITKMLSGGFLLQDRDWARIDRDDLKIVSKREPSTQEIDDLLLRLQSASMLNRMLSFTQKMVQLSASAQAK